MLNLHITTTEQVAILVLQLGIIIFAARFCGDFMKKLKMPSVLGELLAGILIGPCLLGGIPLPFLDLHQGLFGTLDHLSVTASYLDNGTPLTESLGVVNFQSYHIALYGIAMVGSVLLLFMSGLETDLRMFIRYSVTGTLVGFGGVIFSFILGDLVSVILLHKDFMAPCSLFLGILSTATSVGITARILSERKKVDSPEGVTILAAAVIDDVIGIICLAIVMGIVNVSDDAGIHWGAIGLTSVKCISFWLVATAIGLFSSRIVAKFLRKYKSPPVFSILAFGIALIVAGVFEANGLAMIIGAYVAGLSLSRTDVSFAIQRALTPVYNMFVPVFFVIMGMLVDISVFKDEKVLKIGLIYSAIAILAKIIGCALPAYFMKFNLLGAFRIGTGMVPRGEVALIIAGIGMSTMHDGNPILDSSLFGVVIIMTLLTTLLAPPLLAFAISIKGKGTTNETEDHSLCHIPYHFPSSTVAEFVFQHLIEVLEQEGYLHSSLDKENGVIQMRKDNRSFALFRSNQDFVFEVAPHEMQFIRTVMYETIVDLHQIVGKLKLVTRPETIGKELLSDPDAYSIVPSKKGRHLPAFLAKSLRADCIVMNIEGKSKGEIWLELLNVLMLKSNAVNNVNQCFKDLMEREKTMTTCMQNGIALPHARTTGVNRLVAAIGICRDGCLLDALDNKPTRIVVLSLVPDEFYGPYLQFIAAIAERVKEEEDIKTILNAKTPEDILNHFLN